MKKFLYSIILDTYEDTDHFFLDRDNWCKSQWGKHCSQSNPAGVWEITKEGWYFKNEEDLTLFTLTWF